jgi:RNA polymerase sigma factor FliA
MMQDDERKLWNDYARDRDDATRNELAERYLYLVERIAWSVRVRPPVTREDMISAGRVGLLQAIASFRIDRGFAPSTFLSRRIRGAMLDELRALDELGRPCRRGLNRCKQLRDELGRDPTPEELGEATGRGAAVGRDILVLAHSRRLFQVDWLAALGRERDTVDVEDVRRYLLRGLSARERACVSEYFFNGRTMRQVGAELGIAESRVSQLITGALARLRAIRDYDTERAAI